MYFLSFMEGVAQECGIYRSVFRDGKYQEPEPLPASINSTAQDWTPFIAPDESYLIFSSNRSGSMDSYGDLYISYRLANKNWSAPQNLGDKINSPSQERFPSVSPDGMYLFFTRSNGKNSQDVFWVESKIVGKLRPE